MRGRQKLMYKPVTLVEKICRWSLYISMLVFTSYIMYLNWIVYPNLTKQEFTKEVWGDGNWIYLIGIISLFIFLYVRSNLTKFKEMLRK